jgi:transcriptional regulator with XRE-family HTH domain
MKYSETMLVERVGEAMRRRKITQAQLGEILGLPQQQISARMLGKVNFSIADLVAISNHFECTPGELLAAPDALFTEGL